ncbi:MAG: nicotinate phosphoribosyltransferase [Nanoarchaeota archaeon]|nr:nicotinate phosphoribosyltransferase [Nanoarchaeota archaeon]
MEPKSGFVNEDNMAIMTDLYQLTMNGSYHHHGINNDTATFDLFVRKLPKNRNYLIAAGLEQAIHYLENLKFSDENIEYLRGQELFSEDFLEDLKGFKFTGDVYAVPEGTVVFGNEPLLRITAPRNEVQLVETYLLSIINHQTMIASKASRIVESAGENSVVDFGTRRAHGPGAAVKGARACYIAGCVGTSNVLAGKEFGIPIFGTMAHSYIMSFDSELEAFRAYSHTFRDKSVLLIDTYDTIEGAKNAVIVGKELERQGHKLKGVRLDSGDLADLSKKVRKIFDEAGLEYVNIVASNDLNEYKIKKLRKEGARIDSYGVGTEMITSKDAPAISGVYKLSEHRNKKGNLVAKIKLSENKNTLPGRKQVYRVHDDGYFVKDIIALEDENISNNPLLVKVVENGLRCSDLPPLPEIQKRALGQVKRLPLEYLQDATYPVEVSEKLETLTKDIIKQCRGKNEIK